MKTPLLGSTAIVPAGFGLTGLDQRARDIFRRIVESYLATGEPVGSRTLSLTGVGLSPASIRNTMQALALADPLHSPHTSAGRIPTHAGSLAFYRGAAQKDQPPPRGRAAGGSSGRTRIVSANPGR